MESRIKSLREKKRADTGDFSSRSGDNTADTQQI